LPLDRERPRWDVRRAGTAADLARNHRAEWFTECATYDRYGRAKQSFDASGEGVANEYSPEGYVLRLREAGTITAPSTTGPILWERLDSDARGNVTRERLAASASMETTRAYDAATGRLSTVYTSGSAAASGFPLQDLAYTYDFHGNLCGFHASRSPIPSQAGHPFHAKPVTDSTASRSGLAGVMKMAQSVVMVNRWALGWAPWWAGRWGWSGCVERAWIRP